MVKCRTLKTCAGKFAFGPNATIDLPAEDAAELEADGAVEILERPKVEAEPTAEEEAEKPKPVKKTKKAAE